MRREVSWPEGIPKWFSRRLGLRVTDMGQSKVTKNNPTGTVQQCDRRDLHEAHEYQAEFGAYHDVYCPGNDGKKGR